MRDEEFVYNECPYREEDEIPFERDKNNENRVARKCNQEILDDEHEH